MDQCLLSQAAYSTTASPSHHRAAADRAALAASPPNRLSPTLTSRRAVNTPTSSPTGSLPPSTTPVPETGAMSQKTSRPLISGRRGRLRISRPENDSLLHLLHQHAGVSLFVRPICWTDVHSQLLGASFSELPPCDRPLPEKMPGSPPSKGHLRPSKAIMTLSDALTEILLPDALHPVLNSHAVNTVLSTLWPAAFCQPQLLPDLHIFFGDRVYRDSVRTQVMWKYPGDTAPSTQSSFVSISTRHADSYNSSASSASGPRNPANLPMMCYIGRNRLAAMRKNLFRIVSGPGRNWNGPVARLQQLRAKALLPTNPDHDAHFVAIFLAMAQRHFYGAPAPSSRRDSQWSPSKGAPQRPSFRDVKLRILTHNNDRAEFMVYTGHVTAQFLDRFHEPWKAPQLDGDGVPPGIRIEYTRVPIWPILGLRERLGRALGEEIVGQFDPTRMETWDVDAESGATKDQKRKRQVPSKVCSGSSLEEGTESEKQHSPVKVKRRRLPEGSAIGVAV
ncbi:uncharacterized protein UV8b_05575 [Ustilaginoidea virens]|uniref:Uncharacterized protein n=2 Tax=Ustilaginoidea virens TaxID=1159556 RepID=A0A8E5MIS5_USTVR|nr:uncharacterized protein UV8b_05575 [Ustilaginoidea virens]QUC21332.1 hypothetical protein UV8b_05575 [Ustilaginoidea virens]